MEALFASNALVLNWQACGLAPQSFNKLCRNEGLSRSSLHVADGVCINRLIQDIQLIYACAGDCLARSSGVIWLRFLRESGKIWGNKRNK